MSEEVISVCKVCGKLFEPSVLDLAKEAITWEEWTEENYCMCYDCYIKQRDARKKEAFLNLSFLQDEDIDE